MPTMKIPSARGLMADLTSDSSDHRKIAWIARRWHPCRGLSVSTTDSEINGGQPLCPPFDPESGDGEL